MIGALLALALGQASPILIADPKNQTKRATLTDAGTKVGLDVFVLNPSAGGGGTGPGYVNALIDGGFVTDGIVQVGGIAVGPVLPIGFDGGPVTAFQGGAWTVSIGTPDGGLAAQDSTVGSLLTYGQWSARVSTLGRKSMAASSHSLPRPNGR